MFDFSALNRDAADIFDEALQSAMQGDMTVEEAFAEVKKAMFNSLMGYCRELIRANTRADNFNAFVKVQKARCVIRVLQELQSGELDYDGYRDLVLLERALRDYNPISEMATPMALIQEGLPVNRLKVTAELDVPSAARMHQLLLEMTRASQAEELAEPIPDYVINASDPD